MAITSDVIHSQLQLVFETGKDEKGKSIYRTKSFNNVKISATAEQLYHVATAFSPLQQHVLAQVERNDRSNLIDL
ncbi:DUF1659 domain-containing protein [Halobacillus salinarum]|uniref:DUF1659 domain-containing protein n=1 Tax=Halobacillus salinarum TaxID=2932257 RepID=A0ABY4EFJ8_9BACI|nr:DUF1659 domain-containing protein [Halobacillus salinarum]UOQ43239.1 DUF1659 domain-containing protein [Halobacillus salinarum]